MAQFIHWLPMSMIKHFLEPYLKTPLQDESIGCLQSTWTNVEFLPEKLNDHLLDNLPFIIKQLFIKEMDLKFEYVERKLKVKIVTRGLKCIIVAQEPKKVCISDIWESMKESMKESFIEHQNLPFDEIFQNLDDNSKRYTDLSAKDATQELLLTMEHVIDICFYNSTVAVEHFPEDSLSGVALRLEVNKLKVFYDPLYSKSNVEADPSRNGSFSRCFIIEGVSLYTDEITRCLVESSMLEDGNVEIASEFQVTGSNPIQFLAIPYESVIRVAYDGTNWSVNGNIAHASLLLTPRQIFLLIELVSKILMKIRPQPQPNCVPLTNEDYENIERHNAPSTHYDNGYVDFDAKSFGNITGVSGPSGWSAPQHEVTNSGMIYDADNHLETGSYMDKSVNMPDYAHSIQSEVSSFVSRSDITVQTRNNNLGVDADMKKSREWESNLAPETSGMDVNVTMASICMVLFHEDVIASNGEATFKELQLEAAKFFSKMTSVKMEPLKEDISMLRNIITAQCDKNHFQFVASTLSVSFECMESNISAWSRYVCQVRNMEFLEYVVNGDDLSSTSIVELFVFQNDRLLAKGNPCFNLSFEKNSEVQNSCKDVDFGNTLSVDLENCIAEVDLSLCDRAEAFFNYPTFFDENVTTCNDESVIDQESLLIQALKITGTCSSIDIRLKFPVPDLRPISDVLTKQFWKRNVRNDILTLNLSELSFSTCMTLPMNNSYEIEVFCRCAGLIFQESEEGEQYHMAEISDRSDENNAIFLSFDVSSKASERSTILHQRYDQLNNDKPFEEKRLASGNKENNNTEPLFYPTDKSAFCQFIKSACSDVRLHLTADLPCVDVFIPSKHIFEVLYNRLCYDLLLWQPHLSRSTNHSEHKVAADRNVWVLGESMIASVYHSCNLGGNDDDDDVSDRQHFAAESELSSHKILYSATHKTDRGVESISVAPTNTTLGVALKIRQGSVEIATPYTDAKNNIVPNESGKLMLDLSEVDIYVASGYKGDPNKSYVGVFCKELQFAHQPLWTDNVEQVTNSRKMPVVVGRCSNDLLQRLNQQMNVETDMLSLVIDFDFDDARNVDTMTVACKLNQALYQHHNVAANEFYVHQLMEMFKIQDYPIEGYNIPTMVAVYNFSVTNCVIAGKPDDHDTEALAFIRSAIGAFTLSPITDASVYRMILEDSSIYLGKTVHESSPPILAEIFHTVVAQLTVKTASEASGRLDMKLIGNSMKFIIHADSLVESMVMIEKLRIMLSECNKDDGLKKSSTTELLEGESCVEDDQDLQKRKVMMIADAIKEPQTVPTGDQMQRSPFSPFIFPDDEEVQIEHNSFHIYKPMYDDKCTVLDTVKERSSYNSDSVRVLTNNAWPQCEAPMVKMVRRHATCNIESRCQIKDLTVTAEFYRGKAFCSSGMVSVEQLSAARRTSKACYNARDSTVSIDRSSPSTSRRERTKCTSETSLMNIVLKKIDFCWDTFSEDSDSILAVEFSMKDALISDKVLNSNLRYLLCRYVSDEYPVGDNSDFLSFKFKIMKVEDQRTNKDPFTGNVEGQFTKEGSLQITLCNYRSYVDQTTLKYLMEFQKTIVEYIKFKGTNGTFVEIAATNCVDTTQICKQDTEEQLFIKYIEIGPEISILIDFEGNFSDTGNFGEIMLAMTSTKKLAFRFKQIKCHKGFIGISKAIEYIKAEFVKDIENQKIRSLLTSFCPVALMISLVSGACMFFEAPFRHYMNDGSIISGVVEGTHALTTHSLSATLIIFSKFLSCLENVTSFILVVVSPNYKGEAIQGPPPTNIRDGVNVATCLVKERVRNVVSHVLVSTVNEHRERGVAGAMSELWQNAPMAMVEPFLAMTQASSKLVEGFQNEVVPGNKEELKRKYK